MRSPSRSSVVALADRYFAEQCARLGPIVGAAAPTRKHSGGRAAATKMDALAGSKMTSRPTFRAQRFGGHGGVESDAKMTDRFRL